MAKTLFETLVPLYKKCVQRRREKKAEALAEKILKLDLDDVIDLFPQRDIDEMLRNRITGMSIIEVVNMFGGGDVSLLMNYLRGEN